MKSSKLGVADAKRKHWKSLYSHVFVLPVVLLISSAFSISFIPWLAHQKAKIVVRLTLPGKIKNVGVLYGEEKTTLQHDRTNELTACITNASCSPIPQAVWQLLDRRCLVCTWPPKPTQLCMPKLHCSNNTNFDQHVHRNGQETTTMMSLSGHLL